MKIKLAINGYGRIGRNILRALYESTRTEQMEIVAINDLSDINTNAHLTEYDSTHGKFSGSVNVSGNYMIVNEDKIAIFSERDPSNLPWRELDVDVVVESTGFFASKEKASVHLSNGAKKVIISAPGGADVDATIVYGVNHDQLRSSHQVISNGSCTTNCLAPIVQVMHNHIGILGGIMTTVHAYTNDQVLTDTYHPDLRRARSATVSMIPTKTGAASALGLVLPELNGKLDGYAVRVPTLNVSLVDLSLTISRESSVEEINRLMESASKNELSGVLAYNDKSLVSVDFNHHSASSIYDATLTKVIGNLVKIVSWYDNEWGFSNRMLDTTIALMNAR